MYLAKGGDVSPINHKSSSLLPQRKAGPVLLVGPASPAFHQTPSAWTTRWTGGHWDREGGKENTNSQGPMAPTLSEAQRGGAGGVQPLLLAGDLVTAESSSC